MVIGSVTIGAESTIWPGAVLRGDDGEIFVGARTSIQDGTVLHTTALLPTTVGDGCVIGHMVHLEGCTIEDGALVGNGSVVLHGAIVRTGGLVGSNAVVPNGMEVPAGHDGARRPGQAPPVVRPPGRHDRRWPPRRTPPAASRYREQLRRID